MDMSAENRVIVSDLSKEMKKSYLDYAMSVIVSRALPDARDGLKPVHRRILYDMFEQGIKSSGSTKKCAKIVGDVLGKYHPHGDASVYDAMVRLAQDFSLRYPVIKPQGNFGSIDGDPPAAYRYTEAKMNRLGEVMLTDIEKDTVDMVNNFDDSMLEPSILPAGFPFMLANGSSGIAVGMATNMAPHNLTEICDALCAVIENPEITVLDLMNYIKGPDFPTSGIICGRKGIKDAFETGRGKIVMRGRYHIEEHKSHDSIVFTELPYQVNKRDLREHIETLRKEETLKDVSICRDESGREGIRLVIELKAGASPDIVVNHLFRSTALESNFNTNNLALVNGRPKLLNLKDMLTVYINHRTDVVTRRTRFELTKAEERAHILLGLKIGLEHIDEVIAIIKKSADNEEASVELQKAFALSDRQASAIIQMRLGRLSHMETQEIVDELTDLQAKIVYYKELLADPVKILGVVKTEIENLRKDYGDERRTEIDSRELSGVMDKDFIKKEECVVIATHKGFVRRVSADEYKTQSRGGKGVKGAKLREEDFVQHMFTANSHDKIMYITDKGRAFTLEVWEIPEGQKVGKGVSIKAVLPKMDAEESITSVISFEDFSEDAYLLMCTKHGVVKQIALNAFVNARKNGIRAIVLDEGDVLFDSIFVKDSDEAMIITKKGKGLRFAVSEVRSMGRVSHGVKGITLAPEDEVVGLLKVDSEKRILMVTELGKGKQVDYNLFMAHHRGTGGQQIYKLDENRTSFIVAALSVDDRNDIVCITRDGITIRTHVEQISVQGRTAGGVNVVRMKTEEDRIVSICSTVYQEEEQNEEEDSENGTNETSEVGTENVEKGLFDEVELVDDKN
ncbi:MAG: DNA topoisomerase (ATP-hydrolyzing) subunit A [Sphaerochaetaceae bacterium]|nr:DNA topoisomerase (ATP-hydrolyzing) subunit A [Sphaerochaetaceae bacterium]